MSPKKFTSAPQNNLEASLPNELRIAVLGHEKCFKIILYMREKEPINANYTCMKRDL